ncbi:MAG: hypothetical protein BGO98_12140 [Myxococcales bacterium 68-20]|nr:MAG: hypothetical protein BGO98_12140 [Myxococcales bacterium 68-20]
MGLDTIHASSDASSRASSETARPNRTLTVRSNSTLMQDLLSTEQFSVNLESFSPVALFANPYKKGQVEMLVIDANRHLTHVARGPEGWTQARILDQVPELTTVKEVVTVMNIDGTVFAFYVKENGDVDQARLCDGYWAQMTTLGTAKQLKVVYVSDGPERLPIVYGIDSRNSKQIVTYEWARPVGIYLPATAKLVDTSLDLNGGDVTLYPVAKDTSGYPSHHYRMFFTKPGSPPRYFEVSPPPSPDPNSLGAIRSLGVMSGSGPTRVLSGCAYDRLMIGLNDHNQLCVRGSKGDGKNFTEYGGEVVGIEFVQAKVAIDASTLMHVYGIGSDGVVSVLHQTGWDTPYGGDDAYTVIPKWLTATIEGGGATNCAIPFDRNAAALFVDGYPDSCPTVLVFHKNGEPPLLAEQDPVSGKWSSETVRLKSSHDPVAVNAYRTQAELVDDTGIPISNYKLSVSADSTVQVKVGGKLAIIGPDSSVDLETDVFGRLTLSAVANGLTSPNLIFNGAELANGTIIKPDAAIQNYLGGAGELPFKKKLTGTVLKEADVGGKPLVDPNIWKGHDTLADDVVGSLRKVFVAGGAKPPQVAGVTDEPPCAGFVLQRIDDTRPIYREFSTVQELHAERTLHTRHAAYGGLLDAASAGASLDDLWEGVKRAGAKLKSAVVDLVNGAVHLVVRIGNKLVEVAAFVIKTLKDAANVAMAMFNTLEVEIERVVDWLSALFDFKDIWDTSTALSKGLARLPTFLLNAMKERHISADAVRSALASHQTEIEAKLDAFARQCAGERLQDLPGWNPNSPPTGKTEHRLKDSPARIPTRSDLDNAQSNWLMDLLLPHMGSLTQAPSVPNLGTIWTKLQKAVDDSHIGPKLDKLRSNFLELFDPQRADSLGSVAIDAFVSLIKVILAGTFALLNAIAELLIEAVTGALGELGKLFETPITFEPIVKLANWVFSKAYPGQSPPPVTTGRLFMLFAAFPITVGWKLVHGVHSTPFPNGEFPTTGSGVAGINDTSLFIWVCSGAQVTYGLFDCINDAYEFTWMAAGAVALEWLMVLLTFPNNNNTPFIFPEAGDPTGNARAFNWFVPVFIAAFDTLSVCSPRDPTQPKKLMRRDSDAGKILNSVLGAANIATGAWESSVTGATGAPVAVNILTPMSAFAQFLRVPKHPSWLVAVKMFVNIVGDLGGATARISVASAMTA